MSWRTSGTHIMARISGLSWQLRCPIMRSGKSYSADMPPHDLLALDALRYFLDSEGPDASPHQTGSLIVRRLAVVSVISLLAISGCSREVPVNSEPSLSSNEVSTTPATPAATQAVEPSESDESESSSPTPSVITHPHTRADTVGDYACGAVVTRRQQR